MSFLARNMPLSYLESRLSLLVLTAPGFLAASATLTWLFWLFSATCTWFIRSTAFSRCLTTGNRECGACQETCYRKPSKDLLDIIEIHSQPPLNRLSEIVSPPRKDETHHKKW